jgi:hypothetical protein
MPRWNVGSFNEWWNACSDSPYLAEEYREHCHELKQMGEKPLSFKKWAREKYEALKDGE